jgi:hypothetical protein
MRGFGLDAVIARGRRGGSEALSKHGLRIVGITGQNLVVDSIGGCGRV